MAKTVLGKKQIPLIIGNWKMNPESVEKATKLCAESKKSIGTKNAHAHIVIAPPTLYMPSLRKIIQKSRITLGAQDVSYEVQGAHTGETSLAMLKSVGVSHVIVGHSERRREGETNDVVRKKTEAVLQAGLTAVVCIGETIRDTHGDYFNVVQEQLQSACAPIKKVQLNRLVFAYEPVWAIGTNKHATAEDVQEMKLFIQKCLVDLFGRSMVSKVRILYGGSVHADNAQTLLLEGRADGFLVGGASLKPIEFAQIIKISDAYAK